MIPSVPRGHPSVLPDVVALAAVMFAVGLVSNTRMPTSESYIASHTPAHRRSTILGFYFFAGAEVSGLLSPVVGNLIDRTGFEDTFRVVSISLAAVVVVCSVALWRVRE